MILRALKTLFEKCRVLTGSVGEAVNIYFPNDLIGGHCVRVKGDEDQTVWQAAVEACGSERVTIVWRAVENSIWYLAVKSEDLASHANSWCPLAALLPGEKDRPMLPVCYTHYGTYFGEDIAILMVVKPNDLRLHRSTPLIIRAKAERTARELGENTKIIDIDLARIEKMAPIPWRSLSLFEDRARRVLSAVSILASLTIAGAAFAVWLLAQMEMLSPTRVKADAFAKATQLIKEAEDLRVSPLRRDLKNFMDVNDGVLSLDGFLSVYDLTEGRARWRASVPPGTPEDRLEAFDAKIIDAGDAAVTIGNQAEIEFGGKERP